MKKLLFLLSLVAVLFSCNKSNGINGGDMNKISIEKLKLTDKWDKTYPKLDDVEHKKVLFANRFGITLAADMFTPKKYSGKLKALAVAGPFGAVKEQVSGRYAQEMAHRGFLAIAFDPSFTGESGGSPRHMCSPDINTEDFQAAVDFLSVQDNVDAQHIGIIGICGWGGMALNVAALDPRIKVTVASTMYDMSDNFQTGYNHANDSEEERYNARLSMANQRTADYKNGNRPFTGGLPTMEEAEKQNLPQFMKDYAAYYKNPKRGEHPRSVGGGEGWASAGVSSFLVTKLNQYIGEIRSAVLLVHGENAHSRYYSEEAFSKLKGDNKELYIVPDAVHCDLYDNMDKIPFDKIESFIEKYI